jgi:hypothetical protein
LIFASGYKHCVYQLTYSVVYRSGGTLGFANISSIGKYSYEPELSSLILDEVYITNVQRIFCVLPYLITVKDVFCFSAAARRSVFSSQSDVDELISCIRNMFEDQTIMDLSAQGPTIRAFASLDNA